MKKLFIKLFTLTFTLSLFANTAYASTNVIPRTEDNLMVNPRIELTDQRVSDIMNTPKVDASEKVYDFADLLSPSEEEILYERVNQFVMNANLDLALVTISENNKYSEVEYADDFYDYNDFGTDDNCSGMLFLIDMENRRI
ncbi:MAG: TPM domain-containing protein [Clostridia bacterium]|nr:TPM domain-containing protein [Clostridia bacterium]